MLRSVAWQPTSSCPTGPCSPPPCIHHTHAITNANCLATQGFISGVVPLLYSKLAGKSEALSATARAAQRRAPNNGSFTAGTRQASFTGAARYGSFTGAARRGPSTAGAAAAVAEAPSAGDVAAPSTFSSSSNSDANQQAAVPAGMTPSGRLPAISSSDRLNTEAMLTVGTPGARACTASPPIRRALDGKPLLARRAP